jgi:exosortase
MAALSCLVWSHWTELEEMGQHWSQNAQYSHGYFVPVFALALLWLRRGILSQEPLRPVWWGAPLLGIGIAQHLAGAYFYYNWVDAVSLLPCLAGTVLLTGGWPAWRWSWPAIGFLVFMIPLPYFLEVALAGPLQHFAVISSTFLLQSFGLPALAEGNVILLSEVELGIVEACSGLRMLVVFFALSSGVALVIRRVWWEKILVVVSAVPIALMVNIIRITATGVLYEKVSNQAANAVFHDFAGWLMMPLALAMLWLELGFLKRLFLKPQWTGPIGFDLTPSR